MKIDIELDLTKFAMKFAFQRGGAESAIVLTDDERVTSDSSTAVVRAKGFYDDGLSEKWFAFWEEDCAWPPIRVIRASTFEEAYEIFEDEFATEMSEEEFSKLPEDERASLIEDGAMSSTGKMLANQEAINGQELRLVAIEAVKP